MLVHVSVPTKLILSYSLSLSKAMLADLCVWEHVYVSGLPVYVPQVLEWYLDSTNDHLLLLGSASGPV